MTRFATSGIPRDVGLHADVPEEIYHADRGSLSQSGAKLLLPPSTPAKFRWAMDNPPEPKPVFNFGQLAHKLVLGKGAAIAEIDAADYRTKAAQALRDEAYEAGEIPALTHELVKAREMYRAVQMHPTAGRIFLLEGKPEVSMYADDPDTGVRLRGRADWLTKGQMIGIGDRLVIVDFKTAMSARPEDFARSVANYSYHLQAAWYLELAKELKLDTNPLFLFVVVEKLAPHLVSVIELDSEAIAEGRRLRRKALDIYQECMTSMEWPGYSDGIVPISLPLWALDDDEMEISA
jgi:hypothetical protein